jgi:hypothetical protein
VEVIESPANASVQFVPIPVPDDLLAQIIEAVVENTVARIVGDRGRIIYSASQITLPDPYSVLLTFRSEEVDCRQVERLKEWPGHLEALRREVFPWIEYLPTVVDEEKNVFELSLVIAGLRNAVR